MGHLCQSGKFTVWGQNPCRNRAKHSVHGQHPLTKAVNTYVLCGTHYNYFLNHGFVAIANDKGRYGFNIESVDAKRYEAEQRRLVKELCSGAGYARNYINSYLYTLEEHGQPLEEDVEALRAAERVLDRHYQEYSEKYEADYGKGD